MLTRRSLLAAPAAFAAATLPFAPAFARASLAGAETPPVYRFKLGAFTVTAVTDGTLGLETDLFPEAQRQPQEAARPASGPTSAVSRRTSRRPASTQPPSTSSS